MKKLISIVLMLVLFCAVLPFAYAEGTEVSTQITETEPGDSPITTRVEQTEWIYRNNNGVVEKRLWSYTYGRWLTDWIPCD